jgi:hypothetical protein
VAVEEITVEMVEQVALSVFQFLYHQCPCVVILNMHSGLVKPSWMGKFLQVVYILTGNLLTNFLVVEQAVVHPRPMAATVKPLKTTSAKANMVTVTSSMPTP